MSPKWRSRPVSHSGKAGGFRDAVLLSLAGIQMAVPFPEWCDVNVGIKLSSDVCKECINLCRAFFRDRHNHSGVLCRRVIKTELQCFTQVIGVGV